MNKTAVVIVLLALSVCSVSAHIGIEGMYLDGLSPRYCNIDWRNVGDANATGNVTITVDNVTVYEKAISEHIRIFHGFVIKPRHGYSFELNETEGTHIITGTIVSEGVTETRTLEYEGYGIPIVEEEEVIVEDWLQCP